MFNTPKSSKYTLIQRRPTPVHKVAYVTGGLGHLYRQIHNNNAVPPAKEGDFTDDEGAFAPQPDMPLMASRYKFLRILGKGQSSILVKVQDVFQNGALRSVKVLHTHYSLLGVQESDCVRRINMADPFDTSGTLRLCNTFSYHGHYCMVFELLSPEPMTAYFKELDMHEVIPAIRKVSLRLLQAIGFLQQQNVIHADLKPANILLKKDADLTSVKVVDFGNAIHCIHDELSLYYDDFELQTLLYRAPEVVYGLPFGLEVDLWSLGCVLAELYLNRPLFCGCDKDETLANMTDFLGPLPEEVFKRGKFFKDLSQFTSRSSDTAPVTTPELMDKLGCNDYSFVDFLRLLLLYNPHERMTVADAARHSFLAPEIGFGYVMSTAADQSYPSVLLDHQNYTKRPFIDEQRKRQRLSSAELLREGTSVVLPSAPKVKVAHVMPMMKITSGSGDKNVGVNNNNNNNNNSNNNNSNNNNNISLYDSDLYDHGVRIPSGPEQRRVGQPRETSSNGYIRHDMVDAGLAVRTAGSRPQITPQQDSRTKVKHPMARYAFTWRKPGDKTQKYARTSNHVKVERIERTLQKPAQNNVVRPVTKVESPVPVRTITHGSSNHQNGDYPRSNEPQSQVHSRLNEPQSQVHSRLNEPQSQVHSRLNEPQSRVHSRSNEPQTQVHSRLNEPQTQVHSRSNEPQSQVHSRLNEPPSQVHSRSHEPLGEVHSRSYEHQSSNNMGESRQVSDNESKEAAEIEELHISRFSSPRYSTDISPAANSRRTTQPVRRTVYPQEGHEYKPVRQTKTNVLDPESSLNGTFIVQPKVEGGTHLSSRDQARVSSSFTKRTAHQLGDKSTGKKQKRRTEGRTPNDQPAPETTRSSHSTSGARRQIVLPVDIDESDTDSCEVSSTVDNTNTAKHARPKPVKVLTLNGTNTAVVNSTFVKQHRPTTKLTSPVMSATVSTPDHILEKNNHPASNSGKKTRPKAKRNLVKVSMLDRGDEGADSSNLLQNSGLRPGHRRTVVSARVPTPDALLEKSSNAATDSSISIKQNRPKPKRPLANVSLQDSDDKEVDSLNLLQNSRLKPGQRSTVESARVPTPDDLETSSNAAVESSNSVKQTGQKPRQVSAGISMTNGSNTRLDNSNAVKQNRPKPKAVSAKVSTPNDSDIAIGNFHAVKQNRSKTTQIYARVSTPEVFEKTYQKTVKQRHKAAEDISHDIELEHLPTAKSTSKVETTRGKGSVGPKSSVKNGQYKVLKAKSKQQSLRDTHTIGQHLGKGALLSSQTSDSEMDSDDDDFPTAPIVNDVVHDTSIWSALPAPDSERVKGTKQRYTNRRTSPVESDANAFSSSEEEQLEVSKRKMVTMQSAKPDTQRVKGTKQRYTNRGTSPVESDTYTFSSSEEEQLEVSKRKVVTKQSAKPDTQRVKGTKQRYTNRGKSLVESDAYDLSGSEDEQPVLLKRRVVTKQTTKPARPSKKRARTVKKSPVSKVKVKVPRKRTSTKQREMNVSDPDSAEETPTRNRAIKRRKMSTPESQHQHAWNTPQKHIRGSKKSDSSSQNRTPQSRPRRSVTPKISYIEDYEAQEDTDDTEDEVMLL